MRTILITRTLENGYEKCVEWLEERFKESKYINEFIIISDLHEKSNRIVKKIGEKKLINTYDDEPTSPISLNRAIKDLSEDTTYFLIVSKEVDLKDTSVKRLIAQIERNKKLLVVGYKLQIQDKDKLKKELNNYYRNENLIAYQVPWNTCAIWNYELFKKCVVKFDEITSRNPFNQICVSIDGVYSQTPCKGMEDGLAIAKAVSWAVSHNTSISYKLIKRQPLKWEVKKEQQHREKLARKDTVLRHFMAIRDYSVEDLKAAN